jgi:hypothetical protein
MMATNLNFLFCTKKSIIELRGIIQKQLLMKKNSAEFVSRTSNDRPLPAKQAITANISAFQPVVLQMERFTPSE